MSSADGADVGTHGLFDPPPGPVIWLIAGQIDSRFKEVAVGTTHEAVCQCTDYQ